MLFNISKKSYLKNKLTRLLKALQKGVLCHIQLDVLISLSCITKIFFFCIECVFFTNVLIPLAKIRISLGNAIALMLSCYTFFDYIRATSKPT